MVSRFYGSIEEHFSEKDPDLGEKVHTFTVKQKHAKYQLIMDWEYKEETGREPQWNWEWKIERKNFYHYLFFNRSMQNREDRWLFTKITQTNILVC